MMKKTILAIAPVLLLAGMTIGAAALTNDAMFDNAIIATKILLKDPYTAQFQGLYVSTYTDDNNYIVCGELNAKNSYGAYIGYSPFYAFNHDNVMSVKLWNTGTDILSVTENKIFTYVCKGANATTTTTTTTTTMPDPASIHLSKGWNLVGLKGGEDVSVTEFVSAHLNDIESVWEWTNSNGVSGWSVYLPNASDGGASYAVDKGFGYLSVIHFGEGFWVNAKNAVTLP